MKINMKYLPIKAHFFLIFAGLAPILPFIPVYARQIGMSPSGIGLIYTVLPFIGLFAKFISGAVADCLRAHREVFLISILIMTLGFFSMYFSPQIPNSARALVTMDCTSPESFIRFCTNKKMEPGTEDFLEGIKENITTTCELSCSVKPTVLKSIFEVWNMSSSCQSSLLNLRANTNLLHNIKEHNCTYFPVIDITVDNTQIELATCPDLTRLNCTISCNNDGLMDYLGVPLSNPVSNIGNMLSLSQFWIFIVCVSIAWIGLSVAVTISDTICFQVLGSEGHRYGEQRLWGAVGWGAAVVLAGALIDYVSRDQHIKDYTPAFVLAIGIILFDLVLATKLQIEAPSKTSGAAGAVVRLICEPQIVIFTLCCVVVGMSTGILWTFQLMLVEDVAFNWDCNFANMKLLQGLIMGVQCFGGELPFFFISGWFIKKLGHANCMSLVIGVFGIRYILYFIVTNPWYFLPIELMNGFTFGIFYATMTSYASVVAPSGTEATMQGFVGAAFEGVGVAIGGFVGGSMFFTIGGGKTFLYTGFFNIFFTVLHIILQILLQKYKPLSTPAAMSSNSGYMPPSESMQPVAIGNGDLENEMQPL